MFISAFLALQLIATTNPAQVTGRVVYTVSSNSAMLRRVQVQAVARATTSTAQLQLYTTDGQLRTYKVISCNVRYVKGVGTTTFVVSSSVNHTYTSTWNSFTGYATGWRVVLGQPMVMIQ